MRLSICLIVIGLAGFANAEIPLYPKGTSPDRGRQLQESPWIETLEREVAPLKNPIGQRMPMIMWHGVGFQPLSDHSIDVLKRRGLTQHLQMDVAMIPAALKLQQAGMPVILMQGRTDSWPYSLGEDTTDWAHQFDVDYQPKWMSDEKAFVWHGACPNKTAGWKILERQTRETMQKFRDAGVNIAGVWMDFEGDPYPWSHLYEQLQHCKRCRKELPASIVNNEFAWRDYSWKQYVDLYDQHFAKPVRDVYPECLVTNWHVVFSSNENPIRYFVRNVQLPELGPKHFNATNPIAYGCDLTWHNLTREKLTLDSADTVDEFYRKEILLQVRTDRENRIALQREEVKSIPWVARYCKIDSKNRETPIMTRKKYRETLGELWKEEIATMQIFNPMHKGYEEFALMEVQDAVTAFDATLEK